MIVMNAPAITETIPIIKDNDGVIRIARTRVTLDTVVNAFQEGATAEEIAQRMQAFTDATFDVFDARTVIEENYEVETEVIRGKLPCPFGHAGIYRKAFTILTRKDTGESLRWSSLNLHLIREHHFFEGIGSPFRLDPADLVRILW